MSFFIKFAKQNKIMFVKVGKILSNYHKAQRFSKDWGIIGEFEELKNPNFFI